jgi:integrase
MNNAKLKALSHPGRYADDQVRGLYAQVQPGGTKTWMFRYKKRGKQKYIGLGSYPVISLRDARDKALEYGKLIANGIDPKKDKEEESCNGAYETFNAVAREAIAAKTENLRSTKHKQQWTNTIEIYALPVIGGLAPGEISRRDILDVLRPIWTEKPETADRVRQRLEGIFNYAISKEIIDGENPCLKAALIDALPKRTKNVRKKKRHSSMPHTDIPAFYEKLEARNSMTSMALQWLILSGARVTEGRMGQWSELSSEEEAVWTIPEAHSKTYEEHRVPITAEMRRLLVRLQDVRRNHDWMFWSPTMPQQHLSENAMRVLMRKMGISNEQATPHGFRSSLKSWGLDNGYGEEVTEAALNHTMGTSVSQAYNRTDLLDARRKMMDAYSSYVTGSHLSASQAERAFS